MSAWLDQTEEEQTMQIRRAVKQTKMPEVSYVNQIMERVENMDRRSRKSIHRKGGWVKKTAISVSAAAVLGGVVLGSGFVSPAMADALKNVPLIGSVFQYNFDPTLKQASISGLTTEPNLSVTRDGLTLNIKEVMYDGTRLAFMIERQGMDDDTVLSPYLPEGATNVSGETQKKVPVEQQKKGYLFMPEVTIQGKSGFFGSFTDAVGKTEDGKFIRNMAMYEITSGLSDKQLPNEFNMTVKMNVSGFKEPFVFQVLGQKPGQRKRGASSEPNPEQRQVQLHRKNDRDHAGDDPPRFGQPRQRAVHAGAIGRIQRHQNVLRYRGSGRKAAGSKNDRILPSKSEDRIPRGRNLQPVCEETDLYYDQAVYDDGQ